MYYQSIVNPDLRARVDNYHNGVVTYIRYSASAAFSPEQLTTFDDTFFRLYEPRKWINV